MHTHRFLAFEIGLIPVDKGILLASDRACHETFAEEFIFC